MNKKYENIVLMLLLASIMSLVISVFSVSYYFMAELLLLALLIVFSIAIFFGIATSKKWVDSYAMLFFAVGIINGFFIYFATFARLSFLLLIANLLGFIVILQAMPSSKTNGRGPKIIIKEFPSDGSEKSKDQNNGEFLSKPYSAKVEETDAKGAKGKDAKEKDAKSTVKIVQVKEKPGAKKRKTQDLSSKKRINEELILKTEQQILAEVNAAIEKEKVEKRYENRRPASKKPESDYSPAFKKQMSKYYDDGSDIQVSGKSGKKIIAPQEIDEFVKALNSAQNIVNKAKASKPKKRRR
ncbi:MAG: hypothetical protein Q8O89_06950 [Nanoarchaeota archaeon]|nr:hypothetical protein [Nanoarchaeota archaeon]